jgi:outer membrane receptor protein involved in Fe transport
VYFNNLSVFAQDTWKVTPRLTLTYGLRWKFNPAPHGSKPLYTFTNYDDPRNIAPAAEGTPLYKSTWKNFAPRIGAAYLLDSRTGRETTLRGGFSRTPNFASELLNSKAGILGSGCRISNFA